MHQRYQPTRVSWTRIPIISGGALSRKASELISPMGDVWFHADGSVSLGNRIFKRHDPINYRNALLHAFRPRLSNRLHIRTADGSKYYFELHRGWFSRTWYVLIPHIEQPDPNGLLVRLFLRFINSPLDPLKVAIDCLVTLLLWSLVIGPLLVFICIICVVYYVYRFGPLH